jgi:hypothetical protein
MLDEEMIAHAPILVPVTAGAIADLEVNSPFTESFMTDRTIAWDKIAVLFQNHEAWTNAKPLKGPVMVGLDSLVSTTIFLDPTMLIIGHPRLSIIFMASTIMVKSGILFFQCDGVPPACIVDGSKEQVEGKFRCKLKEASCQLKQTEPYSEWHNAAEGNICELKNGAGWKMIKSRSSNRLWDDCLVMESYISFNTEHDIYMLHGEVPETIM